MGSDACAAVSRQSIPGEVGGTCAELVLRREGQKRRGEEIEKGRERKEEW